MPDTTPTAGFDLDAYFKGIGWTGSARADLATLRGVHLAHARAIPFENLDPLAGEAPSLDLADITAKMLHSRRGGYCYEHNTLFAAVLQALGFGVTLLAARVVVGTDRFESRPRSHMALLVEVPGDPQPYLADVGFGAIGGLLEPVPLIAETEFADAGRHHRLVHTPHDGPLEPWVLQAHTAEGWESQYAFTLEPFEHSDFEMINWHVATNPRSPFSRRMYVLRVTPERHLLLDDGVLTETREDGLVTTRRLADRAEMVRVLDEEFGIEIPRP
ncbi:arylamine N-acetyltransferase [Streptomyces sp. NPDC088387]|uniref:arylamine N-acetyltransferase family protein n=1 Tax=Streptomyces sp. NPDC088387 TaxID=3365859 RepID=UPI0037FDB436